MDPGTNTYWGRVGQTPGQPTSRYSGSGEYLGVFVFLVALWTFLRSLAGEGCPFDYRSRRIIWFWSAAAFVSLLLAWGRFAPFYQLLYPLPFFSNIRNPIKFTHPMHLSLGILFAYGLHALWHQYVADRKASEESWKATVDAWRRQLEGFDKGWALGMVISCVVAVLAFLIYASSRQQLETHLKAILWQGAPVAEIAAFSAGEVGWSVFFLVCSVLILVGFFSGLLAGQRAKVGVVLIGLLLVVDLGRANKPWIVFINKAVKYADNDVLKVLRDPPYEGRVTLPQFPVNPEVQPYFNVLAQIYGVEWVQHHFQYYGIQSLDVVQMPRPPRSYTRFNQMLRPGMSGATGTNYWNEALRYWKLTNTKYLLSLAAFAEGLNNQLAGGDAIFEEKVRFNFAQLPNGAIVTESTTNGPYALIENRSALPRVKLFSQWVSAPASAQDPDEWVLEQMREPDFDPASLVMVSSLSESAPTAGVGTEKGAAKIVRYAPKRVVVKAIARERSVLLLNDAYHPEWTVFVDGVEAPLLKCNYLMKGVLLEAGEHDVTFEYRPPAGSLYLSLASIMGCLGSFGWIVRRRRKG